MHNLPLGTLIIPVGDIASNTNGLLFPFLNCSNITYPNSNTKVGFRCSSDYIICVPKENGCDVFLIELKQVSKQGFKPKHIFDQLKGSEAFWSCLQNIGV